MEIKTEEDLEKIDKDVDKVEIIDLKYKNIGKKLSSIEFTKLEHLSLINTDISSINFLINENFSTLILIFIYLAIYSFLRVNTPINIINEFINK